MSAVLVVDDDDELRELIALHLNAMGYETREAGDGVAALQVVHEGTPLSLMLLDLRMPRMNGLELLDRLREEQKLDGIPVVVLTGDGLAGRQAIASGARGVLVKPIDPEDLREVVHRYER
jgi:chemosensory pili system protein ChpA (sensor histidine kinase/response regulator)